MEDCDETLTKTVTHARDELSSVVNALTALLMAVAVSQACIKRYQII